MSCIALLTDFGTRDWFVASMKAVIARINPGCSVIDISHEIAPQNIREAAFVLWNTYRFFPAKTVFVCVVDPGVGSDRRIVMVQTDKYIFLAPDNGLLNYILCDNKQVRVFDVKNKRFFLKNISSNFHGRDIFAPVAAYITRGIQLKQFGDETTLEKPENVFVEIVQEGGDIAGSEFKGNVVYIDRFGNLITNIRCKKPVNGKIRLGTLTIEKISPAYASVAEGELLAMIDSSGLLEIAVRNGNAKDKTGEGYGSEVFIIG